MDASPPVSLPSLDLEPFTYAPLPAGHIRLLHIPREQNRSQNLTCKLETFSLEERPSFEALSYCWGTQSASEHVTCNGARLPLTPHLLEGLRNISEAIPVQWLWIDAICINQSDEIEKSVQVMQMWQIYSAADRVVVWMGPSNIRAHMLAVIGGVFADLDYLTLLNTPRSNYHQFLSLLDKWRDELARLFLSPWFERLWVVQEWLLARAGVAIYGTNPIDLSSVIKSGYMISSAGWLNMETTDRALESCVFFVVNASLRRSAYTWSESAILVNLTRIARYRQTREPLDRVYAILGLLEEQVRNQVVVDYSPTSRQQYWTAHINFFRIALQKYGESYLEDLSSADRRPELPSWCLNLETREHNNGAGPNIYTTSATWPGNPGTGIAFADRGRSLLLGAYEVDTIVTRIQHPDVFYSHRVDPWLAKHMAFISTCNDFFTTPRDSNTTNLPRSLALSLIGGKIVFANRSLQPYPAQEAEEDLRSCLKTYHDPKLRWDEKSQILQEGSNWRYAVSSNMACRGRSAALTASGRMTLAPRDVQAGDVVFAVENFDRTYAMRPVAVESGRGGGAYYRILGPCLVEDIDTQLIWWEELYQKSEWSEIRVI